MVVRFAEIIAGTGTDRLTEDEGENFEGGIGDTTVTLLVEEATASTGGTVVGMAAVSGLTVANSSL